jgi:hypothetical protein
LTPKNAPEGFFFDDDIDEILINFKTFVRAIDESFVEKAEKEFDAYISKMSTLPEKCRERTLKMDARTYWNIHGRREFIIAKRLNELIASSADSEVLGASLDLFTHVSVIDCQMKKLRNSSSCMSTVAFSTRQKMLTILKKLELFAWERL